MKKVLAAALLVSAIVLAAFLVYRGSSITDPYLIKPTSKSPAVQDGPTHFSFDPKTQILSVISSNEVIVVSDPGASFRYEVTWIVEHPRKADTSPIEYRFVLPKFAQADQIHSPNSDIPSDILKVAKGSSWN